MVIEGKWDQHNGDVVEAAGVDGELDEVGGGVERALERGGHRHDGQLGRLLAVVPEAVEAYQEHARPGRGELLDVARGSGRSAPSQRVITCACGDAIASSIDASPAVTISSASESSR